MHRGVGCPVALGDGRAQRQRGQQSAVTCAANAQRGGKRGDAFQRPGQTPVRKNARRIGAKLDARAHLAELRRLLVQPRDPAGARAGHCGGQPAHSPTRDQYLLGHLSPLCRRRSIGFGLGWPGIQGTKSVEPAVNAPKQFTRRRTALAGRTYFT